MALKTSQTTLFEVSWEVCNKVGGIYTVVSSKAMKASEQFGDNYFVLGPDLGNNPDFQETNEQIWENLRRVTALQNLKCRFGRWMIPGRPKAILVSAGDRYNRDQLLYELWNRWGVDSLTGGWDYVEPVMFSSTCGEVIAAIYQALVEPLHRQAVAQFHEWMCGAGLLMLKKMAPTVGTVFTTHATVLGRAMSGAGRDIYREMRNINPQREAASFNVTAKCSMESVAAREANCFTTVSDITAEEASVFLGRTPDIITPNGLDLSVIPDYTQDRTETKKWRAEILQKCGTLLRRTLPNDTRILMISGRYEFHNKGIDMFLDALAGINADLRQSDTTVLALCAVMGGQNGINLDAVSGNADKHPIDRQWFISSHQVYDRPHDPILNTCNRLHLDNNPDNRVQVIFVPAPLDGKDGFLNMDYREALAACDLGVFPSWYEPWGYTPEESAANSVPTITTDLSGFGLWAKEAQTHVEGMPGIHTLPRRGVSYENAVSSLRKTLADFVTSDLAIINERRKCVRAVAQACSWEKFYPYYLQAYEKAILDARQKTNAHPTTSIDADRLISVYTGTSSSTPSLHSFTATARLPQSISRLRELSYNLWWSWHQETWALFSQLNPALWESSCHNPVICIEQADINRLHTLAKDPNYLALYRRTMESFDIYMNEEPRNYGPNVTKSSPIAYFSTEYGISECLPIYSGGLGVLSGDHMKSASDLNLPLVGIGLLYKNGYFRQGIDASGRQVALYPSNDFSTIPVERVHTSSGDPLDIEIDLPGRKLYAQIWKIAVGRISLYVMETDTPKNTGDDRKISEKLYVADRDFRIRQEILLGVGGVRLLNALGLKPAVFHMNEGHSAFLIFERISELMVNDGLSFEAASEVVRGSNVFTTHTPVDAGNERFTMDLVRHYFEPYANAHGISWQTIARMGSPDESSHPSFEMTLLALNFSYRANGVSRLHGNVSRHMWNENWKGIPAAEVPIGYVTNGIHLPTFTGPEMKTLLDKQLGEEWMAQPTSSPLWKKVEAIPDELLWAARTRQKTRMLAHIRAGLGAIFKKYSITRDDARTILSGLNPNALVIGFARRFAPYKRATLILGDLQRLLRLMSDQNRKVILIFSGKAHPADVQGCDLIQKVIQTAHSKEFLGKIFFVEDYNLAVSKLLVQGCDVWLNTPRRPYEASGTSGQKAAPNGCLNLSVSDGWWCEGFTGSNGWTIGPVVTNGMPTEEQSDYSDAESLYSQLEDSVVPLFFARDADGIPHSWLKWVKNSIAGLTPRFSSYRMVTEYLDGFYLPTALRFASLRANGMALPRQLSDWKKDVAVRFSGVKIKEFTLNGLEADDISCGSTIDVTVKFNRGAMKKEELAVQLVIGLSDGKEFIDKPDVVPLEVTSDEGNLVCCSGSYRPVANGQYSYGVRVMPYTEGIDSPINCRLVTWG